MFKEILTEMGRGYSIVWGDGENIESYETSKPSFAIAKWVEKQKDNPMNVYIEPMSKKDINPFYDWIHQNTEQFVKLISKQHSYKKDFLYKETQAIDKTNPDLEVYLHPFTVG